MDEMTYGPQTEVEKAALRVIATDRYAREADPHADAESEHADEQLALACRDLTDAVDAGDPREWPVGWACGEVGTGWPNGTDGGPVNTEPCRLRPDHDGQHDWAIAEDAAEIARVIRLAKAWQEPGLTTLQRVERMEALAAAVSALPDDASAPVEQERPGIEWGEPFAWGPYRRQAVEAGR